MAAEYTGEITPGEDALDLTLQRHPRTNWPANAGQRARSCP